MTILDKIALARRVTDMMQRPRTFFALTTLRRPDVGERFGYVHARTVGIFSRMDEAIEIIEANAGDLVEAGYYQDAVIEELRYGLYPCGPITSIWYRWVGDGWTENGEWIRQDGPCQQYSSGVLYLSRVN